SRNRIIAARRIRSAAVARSWVATIVAAMPYLTYVRYVQGAPRAVKRTRGRLSSPHERRAGFSHRGGLGSPARGSDPRTGRPAHGLLRGAAGHGQESSRPPAGPRRERRRTP